jgi:hypothetical protein
MDNWKQFQGSELGSLMSQLYGSKPTIDYPKPKSSKPFVPKEAYQPYRTTSSNATKDLKNVKIKVPRPSGRKGICSADTSSAEVIPAICAVDFIPKRKPQDIINKEIDVIRMKQEHYRPAHVKPISADYEKDRLSQIFEYKGGKILPEELTNRASIAPFEIAERQREKSRIEAIKLKRGLIRVRKDEPILSPTEQLAEQITSEIEERRQYILDMESNGNLSQAERTRILGEIQTRIHELKHLDS